MRLKTSICILFSLTLSVGVASADDFDFSFTNTTGDISGTVTGEILGLTDNSTGAATDVIITGYPAGLTLDSQWVTPTDVFAAPWYSTAANTFTETNGQITAADFGMDDAFWGYLILGAGCNELSQCGDAAGNWASGAYVGDIGGTSTVTFTNLSNPSAPEPSTFVLMLTGAVAVMTGFRKKA